MEGVYCKHGAMLQVPGARIVNYVNYEQLLPGLMG